MSELGSDGSPGRQRRSTERSRENIREYVKLLSRKVTGSPSGHRTSRLLREVKMSDGGSGHKSKSEGDTSTSTSPAHMKISSKNQEIVKEKQLKKGIMQTKKMKSKKNSGSGSVSVSGKTEVGVKGEDTDEAEKSGVLTKVNTSKEKLTMPVLKSARTQDRDIEPSTSKDVSKLESADNSVENESDIDSISCFEDFDKLETREEMQSQQKTMERNKVSTPEISSKRSTPKSGRGVDCKSDSPPDLILFLKEGRGRAQNYSEPPTLESETIATRRRTRVPADPKTIDISKKINASQPKGKKDVKGVQKKESKREKLKVLETPESLKRLAQGLPLKDQSKSPVLVKQETPKTSVEVKLKKRIMLKNLVGDKILKQERTSTPVSEEDGSESEDGRKRRGRRRGHSSESTSSTDDSQLSPVKMPQGIQVDHEGSVDYLNLDSVLQKVPDNMASDKIPIVIMSNSDQEDKPSKAMPKSRKSRNFLEDKAKTRAFMKMASSSSENSLESKEELMACIEDKDTTEMTGSCSQKNVKTETVTSKSKGSRKTQKSDITKGSDVLPNEKDPSVKEKNITEIRSMDSRLDSRDCKESEVSEGSKHLLKSNEAFKIGTSFPVKGEKEQATKGSPLMVRVSDIISFTMASKNQKPVLAGGKFNIRMQNTELSSFTGRVKNAESGSSMKTILLKGDKASVLPKAFIKVGEISGQEHFLIPSNSLGQKYPVIDYTDIETQEVVVGGELEDPSSQSMMVGHLPEEMDLMANEELGSSSEEERTKSPEPQCSTKKEALSPEGKVALDHSYSSGSSEGGKVVSTSKKKSLPASCDKPLTSRPVYSSASLAKRSLDIMLHNDKINILRQMSQIFNDEKPIQPEKGQTVSSSEGEGEEDISIAKTRDEYKTKEKANELKKEDKHYTESSVEKDKQTSKSSNQKFLQKKSPSLSSNLIPPPASVKKGHLEECQEKKQVEGVRVPSKKQEPEQAHCQREIGNSSKKEEEIACFIPDMSEDPKVHHVPVYSLVPDEQISVQSSVGAEGEHVDIVDGFSFVSFNSLEELNTYTQKQRGKLDKRHCPWLKRKLKRRKKLLKAKKKGTEEVKNSNEEKGDPSISSEHSQESSSLNISGAFSSNDLDTYLNNNAHLNISYAIPKCKTTEEGVTRLGEGELLEDVKRAELPVNFPNPVPSESQPSDTGNNGGSLPTGEMESLSHDQIHYEEVNAIDILYPKEKYKYYYNKDLCKETKADGSNVFVRRAGKLVPLTSVFKSQRTSMTESKNKKTVELVYVYDGGKLLTLGGSLTKINPSNSDSVRARVVLPIGVPPIIKGDAGQTKTKKVQAVEINEDLAKFALSALQNPESKDVKMPEEKNEAKPEIEEKPGSVVEKLETKVDEPKQIIKDKLTEPSKITKVIPTKRNILDIIAAKLAMSDEESEEKEEEIEENQLPRDESLIVGGDTKLVQEDAKKNVMVKDNDDKSNKAESVKECLTQSDEEDSDIKKSTESDVKKTEIENKDDLKPIMNMDFDSNKTKEATKQETESSEHEKDNDTTTKNNECENRLFTLCSTGDSEYGEEKGVTEGKNKIRAGAPNVPHKDGKTDSCINETKEDERDKQAPVAFSRKDSVQALSQNTESDGDPKSTREILDDRQKVKKLISVLEETEKMEACKGEQELQSSKVASEQVKAEQPVCATEENDNKTRTFKKNMYRFPSLSREMKRLNMNFVNYTMEETTQDDHAADESKIKDVCTHEHCLLGCICDTLSCRRRDPEHCGRVECMFECNCRDESWKHAVSGMGRTMNAVSIFNLDREQKEGLALREKDFKKTVIQTGTEVILVGAERKKRERRIPGRYRDSAVWMGGDLVDMDCTSVTAEPEVPPEPDYPSIPISEAHKYIKKFKLTVPWYDVKGISVWCMDHSCYDCKCLTEPNFYTEEIIEKVNMEKKVHKIPTALDSIEEALKQKTNASLGILSQHDYDSMLWEGRCVVVNINVNNTEAKRKYSWKLKEWYHPKGMHSARTCGYSKKNMVEETKHLTLTGLSSQESTPEQVVENVVRSLKDPRTKLFVPALANFSRSPEIAPSGEEKDPKPGNVSVPLVDLTTSCVSNEKVEGNELNHGELHGPNENEAPVEENAGVAFKRKLSGSLDICDDQDTNATPTLQPKKMQKTGICDVQKSGICDVIEDMKTAQPNKDEMEVEVNKSALKQVKPTQKQDKFPYRKPVSLLEMMIAEEKRGELELDLTDNFPGNAMLVAEARFRKLINMNIIGVIGINKSGRCIIATVDSIESMRVMQRIHSMISNNNLDVGPNMREIFFPPPHTVSRPRFVMIRCDGNAKWEIVGVVQKKGPYVTTKSGEQKSKAKPGLPVPQIVDLEEEERLKEKAKEKPDIVILADSENNGEDTGEKEGGAWEGSLPLIASVHSASDASIADLMDLKDTAVSISEALPTRTTKEDVSHEFQKSLVPLEGDKTPSTPEVEAGLQKKQMTIDKSSLKKVKALPDLVPIREPTIEVPSKESIEKTSTDTPISPVGMKTIKINQTSNRIFGDYNIVVTSTPFVQSSRCSPLINVTSASSTLCSPNTVISLPGSAEDSKISHTVTNSNDTTSSPLLVQVENSPVISEEEKLVSPLSTKKINLSSPTSSGSAMFRPRIQVTHGKGINPTLQPRMAATSTVNHRMLYIPVSSSGMSKMVLMPSGSSGPSRMLFMSPPNKTPSSGVGQEGSKMKMVIVPSAGDRGKMVILPSHSIDTNVTGLPLAAASEKNAETEKKFILLPPSQGLNFTGSLDNKTVSIPSIPTNVPEVNLTENVVSNKQQGTSALPEVVEETAAQKPENSDDSDDVVVIGTASNTLTITRVKTSSEPEVSHFAGISTAPSVMIVPSTTSVVSGGGTAQTTVVSSVSTISSTLPQISQAQDCDIIVPAGNKPPVKDCSKELKETEDMVIVKTSLNENQLNALLQNTHKDMLKNAEYPLDSSDVTHMKKDISDGSHQRDLSGLSQDRKDKSDPIPKKELAQDNKDKSLSLKCSSKSHSPQAYLKNTSEVQELESRPVPIKKMGYHWSAVDLSLSFKSVKLEWLLGTIRKNVLVNIFRMSQKTQSPVTLSVKNGSSTSMLYGLARTGLSDNKQPLPILILGSIISAVLSSASTTDNMLFHGNAVKYFIREATGELSSYTYDATGEYLVKLASKKRGHCGEMIGIGEKVPLQKMRESNYASENLLIQSPEKGSHPKKSQEGPKKGNTATQDSAGCSCTASGDFICLGHSTPEMESKSATQQKPVSQPQSPVVVTYSKGAKDDPLSPPLTSSTDLKSQNSIAEGDCTTVESGVQSCKTLDSYELPIPSVSHSQTGIVISKMETETSSVVVGKDTPQSMKDHVQRDDKTSATGPVAVKEKDEAHTVYQSTPNPGNEGRLTSTEADEAEDVDVDIEGESEQGSSMLMQLRQQVASQTITVNKMKGTYNTPGDIARRLLSVSETGRRTGIKRKTADLRDHKYERPCPRSKKKMHQNRPHPVVKGITEQEPRPGPSGIKQPVRPKQSTPTVLLKKKDPLRIQKRFSEIEGIGDERSAVVHNELERMRRRLMGRLFKNLQYWALYTPDQSSADVVPVPKVAVLSIAIKVCKEVKEEEVRLTAQEEEVRAERSMLIKRLASTIADQGEDTKMYWKQWVKTNMKYPVARIVFEKNWKPSEVDKDAISNSSTESSLDLDLDDGSPLSAPSSPHHSGESLFAALEAKTASVTQTSQVRRKKIIRPGRKPDARVKKTVNVSQKLILDSRLQGLNISSEAAGAIPTSILLMAGTSSRGRKIVRKEDVNFVPS